MNDFVGRARALLDLDRYDDALSAVGDALREDPNDAYALVMLSAILRRQGRAREALSAADRAIASTPDWEACHRMRALSLLDTGDKRGALRSATECVRLDPCEPLARYALVLAALARGKRKVAEAAAEQCLALAPEETLGHNAAALVAIDAKRWPDAEAACRRVLAIDPEDSTALHNLGVALANSKRRLEAIDHFAEASKLDPSDPTSREQAVQTARQYVAGSGAALFVGLQAARIAGVETDSPVVASLVFGTVVVTLVVMYFRRRRRLAELPSGVAELLRTNRRENWRMGRATWALASVTSALVALMVLATPQIGTGVRVVLGYPALALAVICAWRFVVAVARARRLRFARA